MPGAFAASGPALFPLSGISLYSCSDANAPLAALPLALVRDPLLGCDRDTHWVVTTEDWYAGYTFPQSPAASQIPFTWQLQEAGNCSQLKMTGLVKYLSKRLMPLVREY